VSPGLQEMEHIIREWRPKPLVDFENDGNPNSLPLGSASAPAAASAKGGRHRKEGSGSGAALTGAMDNVSITSGMGARVKLAGDGENDEEYVNFSSFGVLDYQCDPQVIDAAVATIKTNGVGSCGPRGFYGTIDVHMNFEERIAKFMGTEEGVLYSSGFATIASVIPAFSKATDVLIVDKGICLAGQIGVSLSRSKTHWFNHNDIKDLTRILHSMQADDGFNGIHRVFVVIEGIYANLGDIAPLPEIMKLKQQYPFRLIIEESCSFGVLGAKGRGITEHFGVPVSEVELVVGSLGNAVGAIGGFAVGDAAAATHQRLNSNGYVFSCSLPPFLAQAAIKSIDLMEKGVEVGMLQQNVKILQEALKGVKNLEVHSSAVSPIVHFRLKKPSGERKKDEQTLQTIVDQARVKSHLILNRAKYVKQERFLPDPSIRFIISARHTKEEIQSAVKEIDAIAKNVK
jgi:serine palmitoyltransferase